jgi:hypothetical protein
MKKLALSEKESVPYEEEIVEWDLRLTATCADDPQRMMRFLSGAVVACGGWVLSRSMPGSDTAEINFEFARSASVEMYSVLIATGLELSREAHVTITQLCLCTKNLIATKAFDIVRMRLLVFAAPLNPERKNEKDGPTAKTA